MSADCGDVNDPTASLLAHVGCHTTGEAHRTIQIHLHAILPLLIGGGEGMVRPGRPHVINENINPAQRLNRGVDDSLHFLGLRDVSLSGYYRDAVRAQRLRGLLQILLASGTDGEGCTFFR